MRRPLPQFARQVEGLAGCFEKGTVDGENRTEILRTLPSGDSEREFGHEITHLRMRLEMRIEQKLGPEQPRE